MPGPEPTLHPTGDVVPTGGYASKLPDEDNLPEGIDPDPCRSPDQVKALPGVVIVCPRPEQPRYSECWPVSLRQNAKRIFEKGGSKQLELGNRLVEHRARRPLP